MAGQKDHRTPEERARLLEIIRRMTKEGRTTKEMAEATGYHPRMVKYAMFHNKIKRKRAKSEKRKTIEYFTNRYKQILAEKTAEREHE
jgi:hypothetical protein